MKISRVPFSFLLPLAEIALWVGLVPVPVTMLYFQCLRFPVDKSGNVSIRAGEIGMEVPRDRLFMVALVPIAYRRSHLITAINLPGELVEIAVSLPTTWPSTWHPALLPFESWDAISFPFFCLPAWWLVGRGVEGAGGSRRLSWLTLGLASIFFLLFLTSSIAIWFFVPRADRADLEWVGWGSVLWTVAFGVFPVVLAKQWKTRKKRVAPEGATA